MGKFVTDLLKYCPIFQIPFIHSSHYSFGPPSLGDVLWKDADGFFFYLDRLSNMIRVNGNVEVWPAELVKQYNLVNLNYFIQ
jgi:acyl-CoA synthetase (AMP-forming)/AMP-acid ligase II